MAVSTCPIETLERLFGLTHDQIYALIKQGVLPHPIAENQYDSVRSITSYVRHLQKKEQFCTLEHLCSVFDLTPRRIVQMVQDGIIPAPTARNQYDEKACVSGYVRYLRQGDKGATFNAHRTRLAKAKADIAALEHLRMVGELVPRVGIADALASRDATIRIRLLSIPAKTAARIMMAKNAVEAQVIMREEVDDAIEDINNARAFVSRVAAEHAAGDPLADPGVLQELDGTETLNDQ